jgi:hypothetical protein
MFNLIFQLGLVTVTGVFAFGWLHAIKQRDEGDRRNAILQDSLMTISNKFNALQAKYNALLELNEESGDGST